MSESKTDIEHGRTSRRALLTAAAGGLGAWVAAGLGRAAPVAAADGDIVKVGDNLTGSKTTVFNVNTGGYSALWGNATGGGASVGVRGDTASTSAGAAGVLGQGGERGVVGRGSSSGVLGEGFTGVEGRGAEFGRGVWGYSQRGIGVVAESSSGFGVYASGGTGTAVHGLSNSAHKAAIVGATFGDSTGVIGCVGTPPLPKPFTGVFGDGFTNAAARGVWGVATSGQGVRGEVATGVGVYGTASAGTGYAFRGSGRVRFDKVSGVATIPAGATSVTVTPGVDITADSFVLLTAKVNIGSRSLYYGTDATNNRITIRLSSSRPSSTAVAWLLLR